MKNIFKKTGIILIFLLTACNLDKDLQNPNEISVTGADVDLLLNGVQLDFADFFNSASGTVSPLIRMTAMTGGFRYQTAYQPQGQNFLWNIAYQILINAETLIPIAQEKNLTTHVAAAKILEAYVYLTMVDVFGDIPQGEALLAATGNFNPKADGGADVYAHAIALLAEARTELAKTGTDAGASLSRDIYYSGDRVKWNALANTLELKAWLNISILPARAAEANAKIATFVNPTTGANANGVDLIDTDAESLTYKYSDNTVPDSRHPTYNQYYGPNAGSAGGYIATSYLYELYRGKPDPTAPTDATKFTQDPRWRYYFYRQAGSIKQINAIDPKAIGCTPGTNPDHYLAGNYPFCVFDPGFYGRDHGDASGAPPAGPTLTCAGVYPAGGRLDNTSVTNTTYASSTKRGDGAKGAGIEPIFMSSFTNYMKAEIVARAGNTATAKTLLATAIQSSITQVRSFSNGKGQTLTVAEPSTTTYQSAVAYLYDNASSKLKIVGREFWVASFGNGVEAYNSYRRTSGPDIMQPTLQTGAGPWFRSMIYPANYVNLNNLATQKDTDKVNRVFWDGNPDNLN